MGPRQVLRVALGTALACALVATAARVASARPQLRLAAAPAAHDEPIVLIDLQPDDGGERDRARARLADALDRVQGIHVARGGMLDGALSGAGGDDLGLATAALDEARTAYGALDCAKARPAAERAAMVLASRQAAGVGAGDGSAPRAAWAYVLLCADRDRDHASAAVATAMLRGLGVTTGGDVGIGDDTWNKYPDVDARTAALVELTVKTAGSGTSDVWIDLVKVGPAPATVTVAAGDHVIAAASGDQRGAQRVTVAKSGAVELALEDRGSGGTYGDVATAVRGWRAAATVKPAELATVMRRARTRFAFVLEGGGMADLWVMGPGDQVARKVQTSTVDDPVAMGALVLDRVAAWDGRAPDPDRELLIDDRTQGPGRSGSTVDSKDHWWVYASLIGAVVVGGIVVYAHDNATDHQRIEVPVPVSARAVLLALVIAWAAARPARADGEAHIMAPRGAASAPVTSTDAPDPGGVDLPDAPPGELALPNTATRGRITVRAEHGVRADLDALAAGADAALVDAASDLAGLAVPRHVEVRVVRDARDLARAAPPGRGAPAWAAGVAYPDVGVVVVALGRGGEPLDVAGTTAHEMAHLALGAALGKRAPRWLHEGFAWQHSPSDAGDGRATTLVGMTWFGSTIPLDELDTSFPEGELPAARAYAESYELVEFLAARGRWDDRSDHGDRDPFRRFLRNLARGDEIDRAAGAAFGRPMSALFAEWEDDLKNRYLWLPVELFGLLLWLLSAVLLFFAWRRRRRQRRATLELWARQEAATRTAPPPFVAWPGAPDPLDEPELEPEAGDGDEPRGPWVN